MDGGEATRFSAVFNHPLLFYKGHEKTSPILTGIQEMPEKETALRDIGWNAMPTALFKYCTHIYLLFV